mmetsp:Transcript_25814/g.28698  ORF Transcript_25814/g.28698 Transcript_25814/m.28698 type:complete len:311 (+) Transcript_25814:134-1066(+)|eukprot:CAMPEP_0168526486 /NCGR_PEP_ID=MMETSP0405-20121227/12007_1 /TAXON_ID=498012 /ORGANISM="Trichosphaerium sp, Strain Am-I-7 wt" /LENGTH=310 /DNA_ID=CAMNT_0008549359 /DNA_START=125 /DNA_END=1057 /DNA_ORIENTATION=+
MSNLSFEELKLEYHVGRTLGTGNTSQVIKGRERSKPHRKVALKAITARFMRKHKELVENEIKFMQGLNHDHIIELYDVTECQGLPVLVFEIAEGTLHDLVRAQHFLFDHRLVQSILKQVLEGLKYIHSRNYLHGDIKLGNLLVGRDKKIKIADFGFASKIHDAWSGKLSLNGTPEYIPPECFILKKWNEKFDIWSLGIVCFVLLARKFPIRVRDMKEFSKQMKELHKNGGYDWVEYQKTYRFTDDTVDFLKLILEPDVKQRLTAQECLDTAWVSKGKSKKSKRSKKDKKPKKNKSQSKLTFGGLLLKVGA